MINAGEKLIEVKDLKKNFGSLEVLKGINETIHKGEVVSIIGPSGSVSAVSEPAGKADQRPGYL